VSASDIAYKLLFAAAGCLALVWSVSVLPTSWAYRDLEAIGYRVSLDHAFDANVLNGVEPVADRVLAEQSCHSSALRSAVFIKLRLYELLEAKADRASLDSRSNELRKAVRRSLGCSPYDPFFWFLGYWLEVRRAGLTEEAVHLLELSYATGPNEGWVALRRNRYALAIAAQLPAAMRESVYNEFSMLIESGFVEEAFNNFVGPGWASRDDLLSRLSSVNRANRERFARRLQSEGLNLAVPGVEQREMRYWD
jgi:hypothetical protein